MELLPVLSDEEIEKAVAEMFRRHSGKGYYPSSQLIYGSVAQAQRKADIKWFVEWLEKRMDTCGEHGPYFCIAKANLDSLKKEVGR